MLVQITSSYFCAGIVLEDDVCTEAAPILKYMRGWGRLRIRDYCRSKGWKAVIVSKDE